MLIYVVVGAFAAFVTAAVNVVHQLPGWGLMTTWFGVGFAIERIAGHAPRGRALRAVGVATPPLPAGNGTPKWAQWYIESQAPGCRLRHSCSFVEFDERGDYLDFWQHRHAGEKILELAREPTPLTVVIFVHGWRHSGQSDNVVAFNEFLHQLAGAGARVHGVYLAWRGGALRPVVECNDTFASVTRCFGGEIIDLRQNARWRRLNSILEAFSYFDRKSIPEYKFSGTALSRTIFSCATAAKRNQPTCEVLLAGHSFGGLMLERTFQNAAISQLVQAWPWGEPVAQQAANPLPFDTVLLVNSAAPSIYAKQFQSFLAAHRQAMAAAKVPKASAPIVFSLTSSADSATGVAHPLANGLAGLLPTLWHWYRGDDYILEDVPANKGPQTIWIPQSYYYRHTPGHNPLLVDRFIEPLAEPSETVTDRGDRVRRNLIRPNPEVQAGVFEAGEQRWHIAFPPQTRVFDEFSWYRQRRPLVWTRLHDQYRYKESAYWIIRCPREIIASHNDIWSQAAMDTYAALHRIARS